MSNRNVRMQSIVPLHLLSKVNALVVGLGAFGRPCALRLAQMGVRSITAFDPDTISVENLGPQGYRFGDRGLRKASITEAACGMLNPEVVLRFKSVAFPDASVVAPDDQPSLIISASDSMDCRAALFDYATTLTRPAFFIDNRMAAEHLTQYAFSTWDDAATAAYRTTLFPSAEAETLPCTARATCYIADLACGLAMHAFTRHLRDFPAPAQVHLNLLSHELHPSDTITPLTESTPNA